MSIEIQITRIAQVALTEINTWEHAFLQTVRRNKSVILEGHTRNMLDTNETAANITTEMTDHGIDIHFNSDDAEHIVSPDSYHPEYAEIVTEVIMNEAVPLLVENILKDLGYTIR
jgi:hypothetical protein